MSIVIPKGTTDPLLKTVTQFFGQGAAPLTPLTTGVAGQPGKIHFGDGVYADTDNDWATTSESGWYKLELSDAEADNAHCTGHLTHAIATAAPWGRDVSIGPSTTYTDTPSESDIAAAVVAAEKDALDGFLAGEDSVTIDGQAYAAVRNDPAKYLESLTKTP